MKGTMLKTLSLFCSHCPCIVPAFNPFYRIIEIHCPCIVPIVPVLSLPLSLSMGIDFIDYYLH